MPRNQQHEQGRRWRDDDRSRRDDEGRYSAAEDERDYGPHVENDEGESSVRAGSYDQGRVQYGRRDAREQQDRDTRGQSGSTGRYAGYGDSGRGEHGGRPGGYSGQERYGQSGYGQGGFGQSGGLYRGGNYGRGRTGSRGDYGGYGGAGGYGEDEPTSGYGRGGDANYGGQFARSSPGGFGQAQGTSAWRGHGVEGDYRTWQEDDRQYGARGQESERSSSYGYGTGQHRGKGPKGYQRSDDRLKEMICERLREDPHIDASEVSVGVQNGRVTFDGTVDSRHTKNLIEDVAEQFGCEDVQNNLRVQRQSQGQVQEGMGRSASGGKTGSTGGGTGDEAGTGRRRNN